MQPSSFVIEVARRLQPYIQKRIQSSSEDEKEENNFNDLINSELRRVNHLIAFNILKLEAFSIMPLKED